MQRIAKTTKTPTVIDVTAVGATLKGISVSSLHLLHTARIVAIFCTYQHHANYDPCLSLYDHPRFLTLVCRVGFRAADAAPQFGRRERTALDCRIQPVTGDD